MKRHLSKQVSPVHFPVSAGRLSRAAGEHRPPCVHTHHDHDRRGRMRGLCPGKVQRRRDGEGGRAGAAIPTTQD